MEKIEPGKVVSLIFDLYAIDDNGNQKLVHEVDAENPEMILYGITPGVVVPLEKAIEGKEAGYQFNIVANPNEAFGEYNPELVMELDKDVFDVDGKFDSKRVKIGQSVPMLTADGYRVEGLVIDITEHKVKMDFNHPLAGKIIRIKGSVLDVREATEHELKMATGGGCGCGGCGGGCSSESEGCGCSQEGDGCGCDKEQGDCCCSK